MRIMVSSLANFESGQFGLGVLIQIRREIFGFYEGS